MTTTFILGFEGDTIYIQFVPLAKTVTRFGRLAGSWFNLNN